MFEWNNFANGATIEIWGGAMIFFGERVERTREWKAPQLEEQFLLQFNQSRRHFEQHWDLASQAEIAPRPICELGESGAIPERGAA